MNPPDETTVARPDTPLPRHPALDARFTPGTLVAGRYRIVSLLGKGGMGEVYRADDVKLGQQVALKYVPERLANDAVALDRLLHEVRVGRTISHPNVCRMHDIAETDGHRFIAMEYVDGEDLASLLRRIGRLPGAKAVAVARDICAGLAIAHDKGVIHRDLKPANIMIDGRGSARITDFGLAAVAGDVTSSNAVDGTPAYMAPEQLAGGTITPRSDIYALGLVLYETFTGKRLFNSTSIEELRKQHHMSKTRPSALASDIDPAVERLILRCIEEDPAQRPSSMHAVLAALPGGDPLQAALAAGETPSPQMVAAAGEVGELSAARGWLLLGIFLLTLAASSWLSDRSTLLGFMTGVRSRDILSDRARTIIRTLGYAPGDDHASWYFTDRAYLAWLAKRDRSSTRWRALATTPPSALGLAYRDRQGWLVARSVPDTITRFDPAPVQPGDNYVAIDHEGRLRQFTRVPGADSPAQTEVDWKPAFAAAGLDLQRFTPTSPTLPAPVGSDRRYAWTGNGVRVEAASFGNRAVYFNVALPWQTSGLVPPPRTIAGTAFAITAFLAIIAAAIIARRNAARGRVDYRGARRLMVWITALFFINNLLFIHHVAEAYDEYEMLVMSMALALYNGLFAAVLYAATEPYVRRRWPRMLVGWSRMVAGRFRDPLVGFDVLTGIAAGAVIVLVSRTALFFGVSTGAMLPPNPLQSRPANVTFPAGATITFALPQAVLFTVVGLILLLVFRLLLRSTGAAIVATAVVNALVSTGNAGLLDFTSGLIIGGILMLLIFRFGALTAGTATFVNFAMRYLPLTLRFSESYATIAISIVAVILAIGCAAFYTGLAGKPLFGAIAVEEEAAA